MKRMFVRAAAAAALLLVAAVPATAHQYKVGNIEIQHPWTRATAGMAVNGAGYMVLNITGKESDRLVAASTPIAGRAELHTHLMENGVMKMRPVNGIEVDPGTPTVLAPGGLHVMLMELKTKLVKGQKVPLTLVFEKAGKVDVELAVEGAGETAPAGGAMHEGQMHQDQHGHK